MFVDSWLRDHVHPVVKLDFEEWLATTNYKEERKNQLRRVYADSYGARPTLRECSHIDTFVKSESYEEYKYPRMINSRCDKFKVWFGPWAKAMEEVVYRDEHFVKHDTPVQRAAKLRQLRFAGVRYYATDFTAFESHFTWEIMDALELRLYRAMIPGDDGEFACAVISGLNKMRTRTRIRATVRARRMSGDMITSLGNGFSNLMLAMFLAHQQRSHLNGLVEGDDGLFATEASLTPSLYEELGFTIKIEAVADPCLASFCGILLTSSDQFIREPTRVFQKFGWTATDIMAKEPKLMQLLRGKALSLAYETPDCPIVSNLARYALKVTEGSDAIFEEDGYHVVPLNSELVATLRLPRARRSRTNLA